MLQHIQALTLQEQTLNGAWAWQWPLLVLPNSSEAGSPSLQLAVMPAHQQAGTAAAETAPTRQSPSTCARGHPARNVRFEAR
jgi:hypothetical protein